MVFKKSFKNFTINFMDAIQICEDMSNKFPESTILLTKQKKKKKPNKLSKPEKQLFYISLSTIQNQ